MAPDCVHAAIFSNSHVFFRCMLISDLFPVGLLGHCVLSPRLCSAGTSQSAACSSGSPDKWHLTLTYLDLLTAYSSCCCYYCYECDCDCDCYCYCYYHYGNNDDDYDDESDCSRKGKLTGNDLTIELFLNPCPAGTDPSGASVEIPGMRRVQAVVEIHALQQELCIRKAYN